MLGRIRNPHWQIQGAPPHPTGPNSFVFAMLSPKSTRVTGQRLTPPQQREILDPQLETEPCHGLDTEAPISGS